MCVVCAAPEGGVGGPDLVASNKRRKLSDSQAPGSPSASSADASAGASANPRSAIPTQKPAAAARRRAVYQAAGAAAEQRHDEPSIFLGAPPAVPAVLAPPPSSASATSSASSFSAVLLGTGASNRVPRLDHVLSQDCAVCTAAASDPANPNRRNNVSLLLLVNGRTIMIDAVRTQVTQAILHVMSRPFLTECF